MRCRLPSANVKEAVEKCKIGGQHRTIVEGDTRHGGEQHG